MKKVILLSLFISLPLYPMPAFFERAKDKVVRVIKKATKKTVKFVQKAANNEGVRAACIMAITFAATFYGLKKFYFTVPTFTFPKVVGVKELPLQSGSSANNNVPTSVSVQELLVAQQQGPTCGYHQVKNLLTILEWKLTGEWHERDSEALFGKDGTWRNLLVARSGQCYKNMQMYLAGDDISFLLGNQMSNVTVPEGISIGYDVLENIDQLATAADTITGSMVQSLGFSNADKDCYYGIIVGTSTEEDSELSQNELDKDKSDCLSVLNNMINGTATEQCVSDIKHHIKKYQLKIDNQKLCSLQTWINYSFQKINESTEQCAQADKALLKKFFASAADTKPTDQNIQRLASLFSTYGISLNAKKLLNNIYAFASHIKQQVGFGIQAQHGHWFGILVHQSPEGCRDYCVFDSLNGNPNAPYRLHDERVKKVIQHIESQLNFTTAAP